MDHQLDKSVKILEDALSTSGKKLFRNSTQKRQFVLDFSTTLRQYEIDKLLTSGTSIYDETVANFLLQSKCPPWKDALDNLHISFFEILQSHSGRHDVLEVVRELAQCCTDALKIIQDFKTKVAVSQLEEEVYLENERNTWRLLFILYQDRLLAQNIEEEGIPIYFGRSEQLCMQNLFKRDSLVRESQLIIDWLESNAADRDDEILHFADSTDGWENTLHQLESADTIAFSSSRQIVSQLDPDAPNYERKPLHDLDVEDESKLERRIFAEIRCGKLEEAQKLCKQCGHAWRAALFEGWRLFDDPNVKDDDSEVNTGNDEAYEEMESDEIKELVGNRNRDIWKNMAIKYCKQDYLNLFDKAAIAAFCGYNDAILPVCNTWQDTLWAYMKTMVDIRVESEIRDCVRRKEYLPLPDEYWAQRMSLNEIFSCLESSKNPSIREEARVPEHIIQKYIILDEIPNLLLRLEEWVEDDMQTTHFLRFVAHIVLFFDQIGQTHNRDIIERVLEIYIKRLIEMKETRLVAYYVSKLNPNSQVHLYAKYLENILEPEDRQASLKYADDCGLNVLAVTKQVVENIRNIPHDMLESGHLQEKLTDVDKYKISALDWILSYEEQRTEALVQTNALIFTFLTLGKVDAAQLAFNKIPPDSIEKILSEGSGGKALNHTIKEYLSYKAYLDAVDAFNEWFKHSKCKPVPPAALPENARFHEKVAHEHRESQYKAELERWKLTFTHLTKTGKTMLYNVLLFPEGWLVGAKDDKYLRSICIPATVLLLYSILFESGQHEECVQLADIIASERHAIYKVYSKEKLGEILVKLCESSVALLNAKKDPWGNETSA